MSYSTGKPVHVNYWTGSVTTFAGNNPNFRVIEIDAETMLPVKMETHYFNIADQLVDPKWQLHHEFTELYDLDDLSPKSI